ncbi:MAG: hypothetical protein Q9187_007487, partial [Circinaria calcarea]
LDEWGCRRRDSKTPTKASRKRKVVCNNVDSLATPSDGHDTIEVATQWTAPISKVMEPCPNRGADVSGIRKGVDVPKTGETYEGDVCGDGLELEARTSLPIFGVGKTSVNIQDSPGRRSLHIEAKHNSSADVSPILAITSEKTSTAKMQDNNGERRLRMASYSGKPSCPTIPLLVRSGSEIERANKHSMKAFNSMFCMLPEQPTSDRHFPPPGDVEKDVGFSPPHKAKVIDPSRSIINHPVSISNLARGTDPIGGLQTAEYLLEQYLAEIHGKHAEDPCWKIAKILCQHVDVDRVGPSGNYPLHSVVYNVQHHAHAELVQMLLLSNADPRMLNSLGESALLVLVTSGTAASEVVPITAHLLKAGLDSIEIQRVFFAALGRYDGDTRQQLIRLILQAEFSSDRASSLIAESTSEAQRIGDGEDRVNWEASWWKRWHSACAVDGNWARAKEDMLVGFTYLPLEIRGAVSKSAMEVVAQIYMDQAKEDLASFKERDGESAEEECGAHCDYMFQLIRDFRNDGIFPSDTFFEELLDVYQTHPNTLNKRPKLYLRTLKLSSAGAEVAADGRQETVNWIDQSSSQSLSASLGDTIRTMYGVPIPGVRED